jgi:hypothetical protein
MGVILQKIINAVGSALAFLVSLFPQSPFSFIDSSQFSDLISKINFFIPVYEFIVIAQSWLVAVAVYYLYSVFARWVKAIE